MTRRQLHAKLDELKQDNYDLARHIEMIKTSRTLRGRMTAFLAWVRRDGPPLLIFSILVFQWVITFKELRSIDMRLDDMTSAVSKIRGVRR